MALQKYLNNHTYYDKIVCTILFSSRWWVYWYELFCVLSTLQNGKILWKMKHQVIRGLIRKRTCTCTHTSHTNNEWWFDYLLLLLSAPAQVQNVRVFSFFPIRGDNTIISAKAVWNRLTGEQAGGVVDSYQITLLNATSRTTPQVSVTAVACSIASLLCIACGEPEWASHSLQRQHIHMEYLWLCV